MNEKGKARRAAYQARQEKEGKRVVMWIAIVLLLLAISFMIYAIALMS